MPSNPPAPVRRQAQEPPKAASGALRYHKSTAIIVTIYLAILIIPWVVTCVLDVKPMTRRGKSYFDGSHGNYSQRDINDVIRWMRAIRCLNLLAAVAAVPVVLRVISHAIVVLMQRRKDGQMLSLYKLLSLADLPWTTHWKPFITSKGLMVSLACLIVICMYFLFVRRHGLTLPTSYSSAAPPGGSCEYNGYPRRNLPRRAEWCGNPCPCCMWLCVRQQLSRGWL